MTGSWMNAQTVSNISKTINPGEMITIPAGWFIMGNDSGSWEERPAHPVNLPAYQIGKYEVTRGEYRKFIEEGGMKIRNTGPRKDGYGRRGM
jgi:formylglycine-generating enzyme required for sulfatase activity